MAVPTTSQTPNRTQVSAVRFSMSQAHAQIDAIGSHGTPGVRNPRCRSGLLRRSTMTPADTRTNANSVPTLTISSSLPIGNTAAVAATTTATSTVIRTGVPREPVLANARGKSPSRAIANKTRHCPSNSTITTVVSPANAPTAMILLAQVTPFAVNAVARLGEPRPG